jgi:hypothetical protein
MNSLFGGGSGSLGLADSSSKFSASDCFSLLAECAPAMTGRRSVVVSRVHQRSPSQRNLAGR